MKATMKLLSLLFIALITFSACSKDDDPADNDLFVGTYTGNASYTPNDGENINTSNAKVRVTKISDRYDFYFDNDIPDIKNIKFKNEGDNGIISIDLEDASSYIKIDASNLTIYYLKDGNLWTANAKR